MEVRNDLHYRSESRIIFPDRSEKPFVTILCRRHPERNHFGREKFYRVHMRMIESQVCDVSIEYVTLHGATSVTEANALLGRPFVSKNVKGDYVLVLDDDDAFATPNAIDIVHSFATQCMAFRKDIHRPSHSPVNGSPSVFYPPWLMTRTLNSEVKAGPLPLPWGSGWVPVRGTVTGSNIWTIREVFAAHAHAWVAPVAGDWMMTQSLWKAGIRPLWVAPDQIIVRTLRVSRGKG